LRQLNLARASKQALGALADWEVQLSEQFAGWGFGELYPKAILLQKARSPCWRGIIVLAGRLQVVPFALGLGAGATWHTAGQVEVFNVLPTAALHWPLGVHAWNATEE